MKLPTHRFDLLSYVLVAVAVFVSPQVASAQVSTLNFSDGVGTSSYDQYTGVAGGGWKDGWKSARATGTSQATYSVTVASTTPVYSGGGNYMSASLTSSGVSGGAAQQAQISRQIDSAAINLSQAFSYSFYFRTEDTWTTANSAQYSIYSNPTSAAGTSSGTSWSITSSPEVGSVWTFGDGNGSGGVTAVNSTMAVTAGTTYFFTINTNPVTETYTVSIVNTSTEVTYTSGLLNWRNANTASNVESEYLTFMLKDTTTGSANTLGFSLDGISLSQVPEPSSFALLFGGAALALACVSRRKRQG